MATTQRAKVKLNLRNFSLEEKFVYAKQIVNTLAGNENFPNPAPSLNDVLSVVAAAESANAELKGARQKVSSKMSILDDRESEMDATLNQLAAYVENIAKGNELLIKSAGMDVRSQATKSGIPQAPDNLSAVAVYEGELALAWGSVAGAKSYVIQVSKDITGNSGWEFAGVSTKSKTNIAGLNAGTKYWFRVAAVSTAGQGPWSDPSTKYTL